MPRAVRTNATAPDPRVMRALADPTRQKILAMLGAGEMRAGDIAKRFRSRRPTISKHLKVLRDAGLVEVRAEGRERYYCVAPGPLREANARMQAIDEMLRGGLERLRDYMG